MESRRCSGLRTCAQLRLSLVSLPCLEIPDDPQATERAEALRLEQEEQQRLDALAATAHAESLQAEEAARAEKAALAAAEEAAYEAELAANEATLRMLNQGRAPQHAGAGQDPAQKRQRV